MLVEIECQFKAARCHTAAVDNSVENVILFRQLRNFKIKPTFGK